MNKVSENPKDIIDTIISNGNNNVESDNSTESPEVGENTNNSYEVSTPSE